MNDSTLASLSVGDIIVRTSTGRRLIVTRMDSADSIFGLYVTAQVLKDGKAFGRGYSVHRIAADFEKA